MSIVVVFDVLVIAAVEVAIVVVFGVVIVYIKPSWQALTTPPPLSGNAHIWKQRISKRGLPYVEFFFPCLLISSSQSHIDQVSKAFLIFSLNDDCW